MIKYLDILGIWDLKFWLVIMCISYQTSNCLTETYAEKDYLVFVDEGN